MSSVPMTRDDYEQLQKEIHRLESQRPGIKEAIAEARAMGDLRENAEYHAAREQLSMLNAKLAQLSDRLARAQVVDTSKAPEGVACLGRTVRFRMENGREMERTLVSEGQTDLSSGKITLNSPIGKALVGSNVGDEVLAELPKGEQKLVVLEIR